MAVRSVFDVTKPRFDVVVGSSHCNNSSLHVRFRDVSQFAHPHPRNKSARAKKTRRSRWDLIPRFCPPELTAVRMIPKGKHRGLFAPPRESFVVFLFFFLPSVGCWCWCQCVAFHPFPFLFLLCTSPYLCSGILRFFQGALSTYQPGTFYITVPFSVSIAFISPYLFVDKILGKIT